MTKITKCDRCGEIDELANARAFGGMPEYWGKVILYTYSDIPHSEPIDLCRKCQGKLDNFVRDFMEGR